MDLRWPLPQRTDLRDRLVRAYSSPRRGYHDLRHLAEVLAHLDELGEDRVEVALAAWYHDAVYDGLGDDEERSARLAEAELAGEPVDVGEVGRLVRLTQDHRPEPGDRGAEALCDADLAILAAPPDRYREYVEGVRSEYAEYGDVDFALGRISVLEDLLAKPTLFHTSLAQERWEPVARANVERELAALRARLGSTR